MSDEAAIEQNHEQYLAAVNSGDLDSLLECCADDLVLMPPNAQALVSLAAVRLWSEGFFAQFSADLTTTTEDLVVSGDLAVARRAYAWMLTPKADGDPILDHGKAVLVYRREPDGTWKQTHDIWNSDIALEG